VVASLTWLILPVKIFFIVNGLSPKRECLPPSKLKPRPVPSFLKVKERGGPRGILSSKFWSAKR